MNSDSNKWWMLLKHLWSFFVLYQHQCHHLINMQTNKASSHRWSDFQIQLHCWWEQVGALCTTVSISEALFAVSMELIKHPKAEAIHFWHHVCVGFCCLTWRDLFQQPVPVWGHTVSVCSLASCWVHVLVTLQCTHWVRLSAKWLSLTESASVAG